MWWTLYQPSAHSAVVSADAHEEHDAPAPVPEPDQGSGHSHAEPRADDSAPEPAPAATRQEPAPASLDMPRVVLDPAAHSKQAAGSAAGQGASPSAQAAASQDEPAVPAGGDAGGAPSRMLDPAPPFLSAGHVAAAQASQTPEAADRHVPGDPAVIDVTVQSRSAPELATVERTVDAIRPALTSAAANEGLSPDAAELTTHAPQPPSPARTHHHQLGSWGCKSKRTTASQCVSAGRSFAADGPLRCTRFQAKSVTPIGVCSPGPNAADAAESTDRHDTPAEAVGPSSSGLRSHSAEAAGDQPPPSTAARQAEELETVQRRGGPADGQAVTGTNSLTSSQPAMVPCNLRDPGLGDSVAGVAVAKAPACGRADPESGAGARYDTAAAQAGVGAATTHGGAAAETSEAACASQAATALSVERAAQPARTAAEQPAPPVAERASASREPASVAHDGQLDTSAQPSPPPSPPLPQLMPPMPLKQQTMRNVIMAVRCRATRPQCCDSLEPLTLRAVMYASQGGLQTVMPSIPNAPCTCMVCPIQSKASRLRGMPLDAMPRCLNRLRRDMST